MATSVRLLTLRTLFFQVLPVAVTFILIATLLVLLALSTQNPTQHSSLSEWIFPVSMVVLAGLVSLIIYNALKAYRYLKSGKAGSRFALRLMVGFAILSILPVLVVSYFSMNFIGERIDGWFDVKIEGALDDSLELARNSLDVRMRQHLFDLERVATALKTIDDFDYASFVQRQLYAMGAYEIVLLDSNKRVLVYGGDDSGKFLPSFPADDIYRKISSRGYMYQLEPAGKEGLFSRVAVTVSPGVSRKSLVLTALFPFSEKEQTLAENVQSTYDQYQEKSYQRAQLKQAFKITLMLIMLLSILFLIWAAFLYSLRLTKPIRILLEGTLAVASGNLQKKLPVADKDDFSLLARSFNTMTQQLSNAQNESIESQQEVQRQHDYVYTVLDNLTSGVITLDSDYVIRRVNRAAEKLLGAPLRKYQGKTFKNVCGDIDALQPFFKDILPHLEASQDDKKPWQTEVTLVLERVKRTMVARGALLPELIEGAQGHVLVIEDVTDVMQAEHDAAWSEVARRLAHEIKNPLTPIQLSAERLQYRLKPLLDEEPADLLQRMSHTIIQQVDTMKKMVDAFSEYARSPELKITQVDVNKLIQEVIDLYRINVDDIGIILDLENDLPLLCVDKDRIRQLLVNVIKNAIEAMQEAKIETKTDEKSVLRLTTKIETTESGEKKFVLNVIDNGPGIDEELLPHLFEPYKTSKPKGSGLGLAIVKRIIEEHEGGVMAENNQERGARISIYLPIN